MTTPTTNKTAGEAALLSIRQALTDLLAILDEQDTFRPDDDGLTFIEVVEVALDDFTRRHEGSYQWSGRDGWKHALNEPNDEPFDFRKWR